MNKISSNIEYIEGNQDLLDLVGPLWEKLNKHHEGNSIDFAEKFSKFNFTMRKEKLLEKAKSGSMKIYLARDNNKNIGYCISTITDDNNGEVESLYIEPDYRGYKIGEYFMNCSLKWMDEKGVNTKKIGVAAGNENVFNFYKKFGFHPSVTILVQK